MFSFSLVCLVMSACAIDFHSNGMKCTIIPSDLWLEYIQCEMTIGGGKVDNVGKLHWRAIKELGSEFISDFVSKYSLLQY